MLKFYESFKNTKTNWEKPINKLNFSILQATPDFRFKVTDEESFKKNFFLYS